MIIKEDFWINQQKNKLRIGLCDFINAIVCLHSYQANKLEQHAIDKKVSADSERKGSPYLRIWVCFILYDVHLNA